MGGGGGVSHTYKILGKAILTTPIKPLVRIGALYGNKSFGEFFTKRGDALIDDINALVKDLDSASKETCFTIISREWEAYQSAINAAYLLTPREKAGLEFLECEFYAKVARLTPHIYHYNGYFLPLDFFLPEVFVDKHGLPLFSPRTLESIRAKDIIDVGGCIGDSAVLFEREFCDKNIHTFEALARNIPLIQDTLRLNRSTRIIAVNKALGAESATMIMRVNATNTGGSSFYSDENSAECEECEIITLDSYVREHNLSVGFIKVDIEGFEMEFLKGAEATIKAQKPALSLCIYHNPEHFLYMKPLIESWNLGYKFRIHKPINGAITTECVLLCEVA